MDRPTGRGQSEQQTSKRDKMNVKIAVTGLALVFLAGTVCAEPVRKAAQETGRFSIETVEYESSSGVRGLYNRKVIVKIDAVTGKTWFLKDVSNKGIESSGTTKYWVEIEDLTINKPSAFESAK